VDRSRHLAVSLLLLGLLGFSIDRAFIRRSPPLPAIESSCAVAGDRAGPPRLLCGSSDAGPGAGLSGAAGAQTEVVAARTLDQDAAFAIGRPLDLCLASEDSLAMLPGIGPARARRIAEHRRGRRRYRTEDLLEIEGIGPATVSRIQRFLRPECVVVNRPSAAAHARERAPN
jgi:competence protein ComEA